MQIAASSHGDHRKVAHITETTHAMKARKKSFEFVSDHLRDAAESGIDTFRFFAHCSSSLNVLQDATPQRLASTRTFGRAWAARASNQDR
jgi:hypothetical protein